MLSSLLGLLRSPSIVIGVRVGQTLVFSVLFCHPLLFFWPLHCPVLRLWCLKYFLYDRVLLQIYHGRAYVYEYWCKNKDQRDSRYISCRYCSNCPITDSVMKCHSTIYVWQFLSHYFGGNLVKYYICSRQTSHKGYCYLKQVSYNDDSNQEDSFVSSRQYNVLSL